MSLRALQASLIAERERVLSELELEALAPPRPYDSFAGRKRQHSKPSPQPPLHSRRSPRVAASTSTSTPKAPRVDRASMLRNARSRPDSDDDTSEGRPHTLSAPPAGSVRATPARVEYMSEHYLGREIPMSLGGGSGHQAKRAVMTEASGFPGRCPSFSRMSGVQVWTNAVFLFVNVTSGENEFFRGGAEVTWFAQNTMTMRTPTLLRLIHHATGYPPPANADASRSDSAHARAASDGEGAIRLDPCSVVLICRIETEPYIWCGLLDYVRHDPSARPIKVWWRLRDFDALRTKDGFQRVLAASRSRSA
jgi:hypothetical protein